MRALPGATWVTTGYQRDSSSKRPMSSVTLVTQTLHRLWNLPPLWKRQNRFPQLQQAFDNRSFHIRLERRAGRRIGRITQSRQPFSMGRNM